MFLRSMMLQGLWSPSGMQNLGLLFGLEPALARRFENARERRDAAMRHLSYFNTNPYMAGFVLGLVARLEETEEDARIESLKKATGAAFAAIGDAAVWGALQPACAALAVAAAVAAWSLDVPGAAIGCGILYLTAFNAPTLWMRWRGLSLGYEHGDSLPLVLQDWRWQEKARWIRRTGLALAIAAPALLTAREFGFIGSRSLAPVAAIAACIGLRAAGVSSVALYGLTLVAALGWRTAGGWL